MLFLSQSLLSFFLLDSLEISLEYSNHPFFFWHQLQEEQQEFDFVNDVDDTILSSYNSDKISPTSFTHDSVTSDRAVESCSTPVIEPVRKAYKAFRSWGVATIVITGRSEKQKKVTMDCLESFGMGEWDEAHFKPQSYIGTASAWKHQIRQQIIEKGWDIGPSIGDQLSDMSYGSFSRGFLMPNVRYFIK